MKLGPSIRWAGKELRQNFARRNRVLWESSDEPIDVSNIERLGQCRVIETGQVDNELEIRASFNFGVGQTCPCEVVRNATYSGVVKVMIINASSRHTR